jgi:hypothetical protein
MKLQRRRTGVGMGFIVLLVALFAVTACSPDGAPRRGPMAAADPVKPTEALRPPERDPVHLVGTIHHVDAEGGVYVIRTEGGSQYRLVELPAQFRQEGLLVMVEGLRHDDVLTKDMAGQAVDIVRISKIAR